MKRVAVALLSMSVLIAVPAAANDKGWAGEASLSASKTTGNTDTTDVGLGLKLAKDFGEWTHKFDSSIDYGESNGEARKERYTAGYQLDRDIDDSFYVYGNGDYFNDTFGSYQEGYYAGLGGGFRAVLPPPAGWNIEAGAGYRYQEDKNGIEDKEIAVRGFSDFDFEFNENVSVYNDSELIYSESDTYVWNEVGLNAKLMGDLAARASFRIDHHTDVPFQKEQTDTATRFGIVYKLQ